MTSILLTVNGAQAEASVSGSLTSGMVGVPVTIEYDETWEGLTKNLVCRCSGSSDCDDHRTILNVGNTAVVAHEVLMAGMILYLGVEGCSADGKLVIPTVWAMCGVIESGANADADISAEPTLPVWGQLQAQIDRLESDVIPPELMEELRAYTDAAARAAQAAAISAGRAEEAAGNAAMFIGPDEPTGENRPLYWLDTSGDDDPVVPEEPEEPDVPVEPEPDPEPEKTLIGISVAYTGGEVPVGTAVSALTGITVTASYSDGSTAAVTGYTLSGTINEGSNTVTVTYQGQTATFTVTGVAQSGGEENPDAWPSEAWLANCAAIAREYTGIDAYNSAKGIPWVSIDHTALADLPDKLYILANAKQGAVYVHSGSAGNVEYNDTSYGVYWITDSGSFIDYAAADGQYTCLVIDLAKVKANDFGNLLSGEGVGATFGTQADRWDAPQIFVTDVEITKAKLQELAGEV